jgi:hypothetical protein
MQWEPKTISTVVKWSGCEADNSPESSTEVMNDGAIILLPQISSWHGMKHTNNFDTFTSII